MKLIKGWYPDINGLYFCHKTKESICRVLFNACMDGYRVKIKYKDGYEDYTGYTKDGLTHFIYVGRSNGKYKIPLSICRRDSMCGSSILTDVIEKIEIQYNKKRK